MSQAICAYADRLNRYAGQSAADAAAEELLDMVPALQQQGKFYTILDLFGKIEHSTAQGWVMTAPPDA